MPDLLDDLWRSVDAHRQLQSALPSLIAFHIDISAMLQEHFHGFDVIAQNRGGQDRHLVTPGLFGNPSSLREQESDRETVLTFDILKQRVLPIIVALVSFLAAP